MKVKTISVEVKRSFSYQTFSVGRVVEVEQGEDASEVTKTALNECAAHCLKEIAKLKGGEK